jgi:hypothetical protein
MVEFTFREAAVTDDFIVKADAEMRRMRGDSLIGGQTPIRGTGAEAMLHDAIATIASRRRNYGPPQEHFKRTVGMLNALFAHKLKEPFTTQDWPQIMLCDKLARHQEKPIGDNPLDCAGYAACWAECLTNDSQ